MVGRRPLIGKTQFLVNHTNIHHNNKVVLEAVTIELQVKSVHVCCILKIVQQSEWLYAVFVRAGKGWI